MKITLVVDNLADANLKSEHGLSILVESEEGSALFDTGQTAATVSNLNSLGADLSMIRAVALSHGHYDHTGGLRMVMGLAFHAECFAHPDCFRRKYSASDQGLRYIGIPDTATVSERVINYNRSTSEIMPGIILSGEIPLQKSAGIFNPRFIIGGEDGPIQDTFTDEQCMVVKGESGTAVLLGCSHRGVENNLCAAMEAAGTDKIDLVLGGMHLHDAPESRLDEVADFLEHTGSGTIACCHCTGQDACEYLRRRLGERVIQARSGMSWVI